MMRIIPIKSPYPRHQKVDEKASKPASLLARINSILHNLYYTIIT